MPVHRWRHDIGELSMKILLIRHQKTDMEWERRYSSEEYDRACTCYDEADIIPIEHPQETGDYTRIYVSTLKRTMQTARQLFPSFPPSMITRTKLLDEVPLQSFCRTEKKYPRWTYDVFGRLQWGLGKNQKESRAETRRRADQLIERLEKEDENAILITHGFFMSVLIRRFRRRKRYEIYRSGTFVIAPLEKVKITDRQPHCGGCSHNCLLEKAGCLIGQDKARRAGIRQKKEPGGNQ